MTRHKDGDDGEQVVSELVGRRNIRVVAENHEAAAALFKEPVDELAGEAAEAVAAVGNHNFSDQAGVDAVQKGDKAGPVPVEAGADVADELVAGVGGAEVGELPLEVGALVLGADAGVADALSRRGLLGSGEKKLEIVR
jgi:hypothetical protein